MTQAFKTLDPKNDIVFKLLFGKPENKDILISLLSAVIQPDIPIADLTIKNPELPDINAKDILMDILVELENGHQIDVEMQSCPHPGIKRRGLYYWARMFYNQLEKGKPYSTLKPSIVVFFMDFNRFPNERFHSVFEVLERNDHIRYSDVLELHSIELPKLRKRLKEEGKSLNTLHRDNKLYWWSRFLAAEDDSERQEAAMSDPMIEKANKELKEISVLSKAQDLARQREMSRINRKIEAAAYYEEGLEKGEAIGLEKGEAVGLEKGEAIGIEKGRSEGLIQSIFSVLEVRGVDVPDEAKAKILACENADQLELWLKKAVTIGSVDELFE